VVGPEVGGRHAKRKKEGCQPGLSGQSAASFFSHRYFLSDSLIRFFIEFPGPLGAIRGSIRNQSNDHHDQTDDDNCA
jgi:hypothetical protein